MVRERSRDDDSAIIWSAPRLLRAEEVAERVVGLLDSRELVAVIPRWRGWVARGSAMLGRHAIHGTDALHSYGRRRRARTS
jgi:hypothetical protein